MKRINNLAIVTLNTQGILAFSSEYFKKCNEIANYYNTQQLDIINLQEVFFYHHFFLLKKIFTSFPYFIYKPSIFGPEAGLITFSRLPLQFGSHKHFKKMGTIWNRSVINILGRKGMLLSKINNIDMYILNTHFSANLSLDWDTENQDTLILKEQVKEFHTFISQLQRPCIITGDFNIQKNSFLYISLMKNNLHDAFKNIYKPTQNNNLQIDYILFTGENLFVKSKEYIFTQKVAIDIKKKVFLSDHVGLKVTFGINKKQK